MNDSFLGIDISKATFDVHLTQGEQSWSGQFSNHSGGFTQFQKWLQKKQIEQLHACMEATGRYGESLAYFLHEQGYLVSIVNPKIIKHYGHSKMQRNKTDKLDARLIAEYCRKENPRAWQPPGEALRILRAMTRRLEALQSDRTREINRLKAGDHPQPVKQSLEVVIAFYDQQIENLEQQIQDHINQYPDELQRKQDLLTSIPGIGNKTAAILLGELPDLALFKSAKQVTAFAGLTPRQLQSGQMKRSGGIYKLGSKRIRQALFFPAMSGKRHNPILNAMAGRLEERGKSGMTIIAALMRKLLQLVYGILKSERPFDPQYAVNVQNAT